MARKRRQRKRKKSKKESSPNQSAEVFAASVWSDDDSIHALLPENLSDPETLDKFNQLFQENIRNSVLWDQLVEEYGEEKAEVLLKEFRFNSAP